MLYGAPQSGYNGPPNQGLNLTALIPGEPLTLLNGTETLESGSKTVAFARGYSPSANDAGTTFDASGMADGTEIDIQAANQDIDGSYFTVGSITPDTNGNGGWTDTGRSAFYRAVVTTYVSGQPILIAQR